MTVSESQRLKLLEDENRRLKHLVADLTLDNQRSEGGAGKEVVTCPARREATRWVQGKLRLSERRACRLMRISGSSLRYTSRRARVEGLLGFLEVRVDAWVPLSAESIVASDGMAAVQVGARTSHYKAWAIESPKRSRGAHAYVLTQTLLGLPVVATVALVVWGMTFGLLVTL